MKPARGEGFTLIELLVVLACMSILMSIMAPAVRMVRRQARGVVNVSNQRQIVAAVNLFAIDNNDRYPASVATIGDPDDWHWQEPTMITGYEYLSPGPRRSMSVYLRSYLNDADTMFCPNAPRKYARLQEAWNAGDNWNNPDTGPMPDPLFGSYCFYWNYVGCLEDGVFEGPRSLGGRGGCNKLLVTDYFGYDHWRSPGAHGSCESFKGAGITEGTDVSSAYWSRLRDDDPEAKMPDVKLRAGYADGHVGTYTPSETVPMRVAITADGSQPYPEGVGPGIFYLPRDAVR